MISIDVIHCSVFKKNKDDVINFCFVYPKCRMLCYELILKSNYVYKSR